MTTFHIERWGQFWLEARELFAKHHEEAGYGEYLVDVNFEDYAALERAGQLLVITARDGGKLVGYVTVLVRKHPHYALLCGFQDAFFLEPSARKGATGTKLLQAALYYLEARGAKRVFFNSRTSKNLTKLFSHLGFVHSEEVWSKEL